MTVRELMEVSELDLCIYKKSDISYIKRIGGEAGNGRYSLNLRNGIWFAEEYDPDTEDSIEVDLKNLKETYLNKKVLNLHETPYEGVIALLIEE